MQEKEKKEKTWEASKLRIDNEVNLVCTNFNDVRFTPEEVEEDKVIRLGNIVTDL